MSVLHGAAELMTSTRQQFSNGVMPESTHNKLMNYLHILIHTLERWASRVSFPSPIHVVGGN